MKFVSWNIRHGGSRKKLNAICDQLSLWNPDVVGLTEFRDSESSKAIAARLTELGLSHQLTTKDAPERGKNFLCLASRFPLEQQSASGRLADLGRWLHADVQGMDVALMHVPNRSPDKWQFHAEVVRRFAELREHQAIGFGDTNTGQPKADEENPFFNEKEADWFQKINKAGWVDVWREFNLEGREFTWYSNYGNGFRLDQLFAPQHFLQSINDVRYDWGEGGRDAELSDHAAIVFEVENAGRDD